VNLSKINRNKIQLSKGTSRPQKAAAAEPWRYTKKETNVKNMKDKTVVITGATSGLGRATALQLAQKGASVVIIARSNTKANEVIKEIKKEGENYEE